MRRIVLPILGMLLLVLGTPARAVQLDAQGCVVMAIWARDILWARDMGADRGKVKSWLDAQRAESPVFVVLLPMFDELWKTKAPGVDVMNALYRDCAARRGSYGTDT